MVTKRLLVNTKKFKTTRRDLQYVITNIIIYNSSMENVKVLFFLFPLKSSAIKMLGLHLNTLIIGHKSCNMLSILNKWTLLKEMQKFVTKIVLLEKSKHTTTTKQNNQTYKPLPEPGIEPVTSCTKSGCVTTAPPSQLRVSIVVKPFNYFDAMGLNVNKQIQICGPDIFNKYIFSVLFLHAWITIFGSFSYLRK